MLLPLCLVFQFHVEPVQLSPLSHFTWYYLLKNVIYETPGVSHRSQSEVFLASIHISSLMRCLLSGDVGCLFISWTAKTIVTKRAPRPLKSSEKEPELMMAACVQYVCVCIFGKWIPRDNREIAAQRVDLSWTMERTLSTQCRTSLSLKSGSVKKTLMLTSMNQFAQLCSSVRRSTVNTTSQANEHNVCEHRSPLSWVTNRQWCPGLQGRQSVMPVW